MIARADDIRRHSLTELLILEPGLLDVAREAAKCRTWAAWSLVKRKMNRLVGWEAGAQSGLLRSQEAWQVVHDWMLGLA